MSAIDCCNKNQFGSMGGEHGTVTGQHNAPSMNTNMLTRQGEDEHDYR